MLFNPYIFLFAFLPMTLAGFLLLRRFVHFSAALAWLVLASLFFYGWWEPVYLLLISGSMLGNFVLRRRMTRRTAAP